MNGRYRIKQSDKWPMKEKAKTNYSNAETNTKNTAL